MIPLFFQVVLLDSASKAGLRLVIPSLSTPVGGLIAGFVMSRWGQLGNLVRVGCLLMMLGNGLVASLQYQDCAWKYVAYLFPANIGQGIVYPSILFTNIAAFEQSREWHHIIIGGTSEADALQNKLFRHRQYTCSVAWEPYGVLPPHPQSSKTSFRQGFHRHCPKYQIKRKWFLPYSPSFPSSSLHRPTVPNPNTHDEEPLYQTRKLTHCNARL